MVGRVLPKRIREIVMAILEKLNETMRQTNMNFADIYKYMEEIIYEQREYALQPSEVDRERRLSTMLAWALDNGVSLTRINIAQYSNTGFGLVALKDLKKGEKFVEIPTGLIFTLEPFYETEFGKLVKDLPLIPGVKMALAILAELENPDSFWMPYLNSLPDTYTIPLYFSPEEMEMLAETTLLGHALKFYQLVVREYMRIFELMETTDKKKLSPIKSLCFRDFRWALATALTRENRINWGPDGDGRTESVLIPIWDMCNHAWAEEVTTFSYGSGTIISEAMMDVKRGEQIFTHYGQREVHEMFLYGGYVMPDLPSATFSIPISLSTQDECYKLKFDALNHIGIRVPHFFEIKAVLPEEGLAFARIFSMTKKMLLWFLENPGYLWLLKKKSFWVSIRHEIQTWNFLKGRCMVVERSFKKTLEEDINFVKECQSDTTRVIYQLRILEKQLIRRFASYCQDRLSYLEDHAADFESNYANLYGSLAIVEGQDIQECPIVCVGPQCPKVDDTTLTIPKCCHLDEMRSPNIRDVHERYLVGFEKQSERSTDTVVKLLEDNPRLEPDEAKEVVAEPWPEEFISGKGCGWESGEMLFQGRIGCECCDPIGDVIVQEAPEEVVVTEEVVVVDEAPEEVVVHETSEEVVATQEVPEEVVVVEGAPEEVVIHETPDEVTLAEAFEGISISESTKSPTGRGCVDDGGAKEIVTEASHGEIVSKESPKRGGSDADKAKKD